MVKFLGFLSVFSICFVFILSISFVQRMFVKAYSVFVFCFTLFYFCAQLALLWHKMGFQKRNPVCCTSFMGSKGSTYDGSFTSVVQEPIRPYLWRSPVFCLIIADNGRQI
jgi:ammonia channel protein AmtB